MRWSHSCHLALHAAGAMARSTGGTWAARLKRRTLSIIRSSSVSSMYFSLNLLLSTLDDTLTSIAVQYSISVQVLKRTNKMYLTCDSIEPGTLVTFKKLSLNLNLRTHSKNSSQCCFRAAEEGRSSTTANTSSRNTPIRAEKSDRFLCPNWLGH